LSKVLVCGIYLADREHLARVEAAELASSRRHDVVQRWIALDPSGLGDCSVPGTVAVVRERTPKFTLVNRLIEDRAQFDQIFICDDDVGFPPGFLDRYLEVVDRCGFALSQPARTEDSFLDHFIVTRIPGLDARRTRFVEIGPVTCIARSAYGILLPFDLQSPMGWGLDLVWPCQIEQAGLRMGIVDATPVSHRLRKAMANYKDLPVRQQMAALLRRRPKLTLEEAFTVLETYA
jgi:hypothetical protein